MKNDFEDKILFEDESLRDECTRHYKLKDGTCAAVTNRATDSRTMKPYIGRFARLFLF